METNQGKSQKQEIEPLKNILLVGTKIDKCYDQIPMGKPHNDRKVTKDMAEALCKKLNLAGCVET
jgi:hypothetical protein